MTITIEGYTTGSNTGDTSLTFSSWTPGQDELILIGITCRDYTITPSNVRGCGGTYDLVDSMVLANNEGIVHVFRGMPGTPLTGSLLADLTGNSSPVFGIAVRISGVDTSGSNGSGAIENSDGAAGDNNDMLVTISYSTSEEIILVGFGNSRTKTLTVPSGEDEITINNTVGGGQDKIIFSSWYETVYMSGYISLGDSNDLSGNIEWGLVGVVVKAPSAGISDAGDISSAEAFGTAALSFGDVLPSGITSGEAIGTATVSFPPQTITSAGNIATAEALGSPALSFGDIVPGSITTAEAFGTTAVTFSAIEPSAIASIEAIGSAGVTFGNIEPNPISSSETIGTAALSFETIQITGISSGESFGTPAVGFPSEGISNAGGIASGEAIGTNVLCTYSALLPTGISTSETLGTAAVTFSQVQPGGISSSEVIGSAALSFGDIEPTPISSSENFGNAAVTFSQILPSGAGSGEAMGTAALSFGNIEPSGIASSETIGTAALSFEAIQPSGISSGEGFGTVTVTFAGLPITDAGAIASIEAFGTAALAFGEVLPSGIGSSEAFGTATVAIPHLDLTDAGGITSSETFGSATFTFASITLSGIITAEAIGTARLYTPRIELIRNKIRIFLMEITTDKFDNDTLDEGLRQALDDYSLAYPLEMEDTLTLTSPGREINLSSLTGLIDVRNVWWPYDSDADRETWPPNKVQGFSVWWDATVPVLFLDIIDASQPKTDQEIRIWYNTRHTIQGLDGSFRTTYITSHEGFLVQGAAGYAAMSRVVDLTEVEGTDMYAVGLMGTWGRNQIGEFKANLNLLRGSSAREGIPWGKGWKLDKWSDEN